MPIRLGIFAPERMPAPATVLLRLRWLQLRRALPLYGIVLLALASCTALWMLHGLLLSEPTYAAYLAMGALLSVWGLHQRRTDLPFLHRHVAKARIAMAAEYSALLLPVLITLLLAHAWREGRLLPLACALPWLPVLRSSSVRAHRLRRLIPARLVEWRGAMQGAWPGVLLLWLAALAFCWLPVLPHFLIGAVAMLACSAQEPCESRTMLLATAPDSRSFLRAKVLGAVRLIALVIVPVLIAATCFMPDWWWINALFGLGLLVLVAYAVVLKYANYLPNERLSANGANVAVAAVFAILPGLGLVPLVMLLTEWPKARANLNSYFHDHHR